MFYNTYRATKSSMRSADKIKITGGIQYNPKDRLLNLRKREKLKDLLITKFMQKYGVKNPEKVLEDEIGKFVQGERLNDIDLIRLDAKLQTLLKKKNSKSVLKNTLSQSLNQNAPLEILPPITKKVVDNELPKITKKNPTILSTEPDESFKQPQKLYTSSYTPMNTISSKSYKIKYKKPEEELAELEAEFALEEKNKKKEYKKLDFSDQGDEWAAMAKYNRKLYEQQIIDEKMRDNELKLRNKADLDLQVKQKLKRDYEEELKNQEYDKMVREHQKKMDELEREKNEQIKKKLLREKESRDEQMRQNYMKKRIEFLKEKKFEKSLVKTIQEGIEKEKKEAIEKKIKENKALINAIKENDIKIKKKKEQEKKQKEEDVKMGEERYKMQMKEDLARQKYYDTIRSYGAMNEKKADEVLERLKKEQIEEEKKIQFYYDEKNRLAIEKEKEAELKKQKNKIELKRYLDMQIEEKKKEDDFLKSLDNEQARIWKIDTKKYWDDEKSIENKIREMNKRNLDVVMAQIKKKQNKKTGMNDTEYAMNRETLEKARESLSK